MSPTRSSPSSKRSEPDPISLSTPQAAGSRDGEGLGATGCRGRQDHPRKTSGKVGRAETRARLEAGTLLTGDRELAQ
jgi:hypothetical protein